MFDKILYWKRRKNVDKETKQSRPLRGQGPKLNPVVGISKGSLGRYKPLGAKAIRKGTKRTRKLVG